MKIHYKSNKLEKQLTKLKIMQRTFGVMTQKVRDRMFDLKAVDCLADARPIISDLHLLKGKRKGSYAFSISGNYRIVFEPYGEVPFNDNGSINEVLVTEIEVVETKIDYH
jgi:plasmid maintenance system killer protein